MTATYTLRAMQPGDGPALADLMQNDPVTPGMSMTTRFLVDPFEAWTRLKPSMIGVVAEAPDADGIIGSATAAFDPIQFDGRVLPSAYVENLKVHHGYRGQGVATGLTQWLVDAARERFGSDVVMLSGASSDNTASLATMKKWTRQYVGPFSVAARATRSSPPRPPSGIAVRPAETGDLAEIVEKSNRFYADYNLYSPLTVEKLSAALAGLPTVYHYRVAVDSAGKIVAGGMISTRGDLMVDDVRNVPLPVRLINAVVHMLPADGSLRVLEVASIWFEQAAVGRYLWQFIRWDFRTRGSMVSSAFDGRGPLKDVYQVKPWQMPKIDVTFAVGGPEMMSNERLIANTLRG